LEVVETAFWKARMIELDGGKSLPVVVGVLMMVEKVVMVMGLVMKKKEVVVMVFWNDNGDSVFGGEREREEGDRQRLAGQWR